MTMQRADPFRWKGKNYVFLGADDVYSLFDPEKYGLELGEARCSCCWKGFNISFSVRRNRLFICSLDVCCAEDKYPVINGVTAKENSMGCHEYKGLDIPTEYTGKIVIGDELDPAFEGRAFIGPHSYNKTWELVFENGILKDSKETSGSYTGI
ncbi:MAG: hypothetical protein IK083_05770 [Abditibacteriota bacterium]|nr:hypothetical protein [Abditibacteriota bacterium]